MEASNDCVHRSFVESMEKTTRKLSRQAKVFLRVDKEGYLTDTQTVSDVVNFDCYESVNCSLRRTLAALKDTGPEYIDIESVFYYKKRQRSSRMNPVLIKTTTDVFRAIAEHPTGEIPIGVVWLHRVAVTGTPNIIVKVEQSEQPMESPIRVVVPERKRKFLSNSPLSLSQTAAHKSDIAEKIRKLENYKTYMPGATENETIKPSTGIQHASTSDMTDPKFKVIASRSKTRSLLQAPSGTHASMSGQKTESEEDARYPYKSQYQWPDDCQCEVILSYDGISERKTLMPGVAFVVQNLMKGNYNVLSQEVASSLQLTKLSNKKPLDTLDEINRTSKYPRPSEFKEELTQARPIKYLQDAKTEIFKVMSLLNLSKSRFKQLLTWMKSLSLEEGKRGKFYLSERNTIGKSMQVCYDTNEEAAMKLNQIYKSARAQLQTNVLHPIIPGPSSQDSQNGNAPLMYLLPQTTSGRGVNSMTPIAVAASSPISSSVKTSSSNGPSNSGGQQHVPTSQGLFEVRNNAVLVNVAAIQTTAQETKQKIHTVPSILRKKKPSQKKIESSEHPPSPENTDPTPMHLFRSRTYKPKEESEDHRSDTESPEVPEQSEDLSPPNNVLTVKQEPVDYTSDTAENYARDEEKCLSPTSGFFENKRNNYNDVLKSDAQMPQSSEQTDKPFDMNVIIKSEPMDDY